MRVTTDITTPRERETAVALGFFDGVHRGHRAVIDAMTRAARAESLVPIVFTFTTNGALPDSKRGLTLLQTEPQKERIMAELGVAEVVAPEFSAFMSLSPQDYVDNLLAGVLRARVLVCGADYRFGSHAAAGVPELEALAKPHGIRVVTVPAVLWQEQVISSTRIRQAVQAGKMEEVDAMLGASLTIEGRVERGKQLGRTLHSPTINLNLPSGFTNPAHGVYLSRVTTQLGDCWGVTNIGSRPTVGGNTVNCETTLLDFTGELYGTPVAVALRRWLRPEEKFPSLEALASQIQVDIQTARGLITNESLKG